MSSASSASRCWLLFLGPLLLRRGWGPDGTVVHAALVSLMFSALFLDVLSNRKQVWLVIGLAAGLAYLRRHHDGRQDDPAQAAPKASGSPATNPVRGSAALAAARQRPRQRR